MRSRSFLVLLLSAVLASCATERAILFDGLGSHARRVTTNEALAQTYFDQGLILAYGFNHEESERSFAEAIRLDPDCAMAHWGRAYVLGPYINRPMTPENGLNAYAAIQRALALALENRVTPVERDLIHALATRYASPPATDRRHLDRAYAEAMRALWMRYPDDPDIAVLFADSVMNIDPWNQWTPDLEPRPGTLEIAAALERALELDPSHPGANHFYIHVIEPAGRPEKAEAAADRLGTLVPGMAHMVHMPSHIYVQLGRFRDSMEVNEKASRLDREYVARANPKGGYYFSQAHNNHFRVWSAMYQGRYQDALESCAMTLRDLPPRLHGEPGVADWLSMHFHVHLRFGRWEAALDCEAPRADQPYALAMWHYARGMALANTGRIEEAREEARAFEVEAAKVPREQRVFMTPCHQPLAVAREMLAGETAYHAGEFETAFRQLRAAVAAEDRLRYSEPSPWMMPTRHALGALLLAQGHLDEARNCYEQDLRKHPGNGWSLHGLAECLERQGALAEAAEVRIRFEEAWRFATVEIEASCFCRRPE